MKTILVIEDDPNVRDNIAELLEFQGFVVLGAKNGSEGIDLARSHQPDIIVCDVMLPEKDGFEVIEEIRSNRSTATIPFLFLTARTAREDRRTGMGLGADDFITKPFTHTELLIAVHTQLAKHAASIELRRIKNRLETILTSSPDIILLLDETGQVQSYNPAFETFFLVEEDISGLTLQRLIDPRYVETVEENLRAIWKSEEKCHIQAVATSKENDKVDVEIILSILDEYQDNKSILCIIHDVRSIKRAAIIDERSRLARDLHDAVSQTLWSAKLLSEMTIEIWQDEPENVEEQLLEINRLISGAMAEMRTLLMELRPEALLSKSIADLVTQLTQSLSVRTNLEIDIDVSEAIRLLPEQHIVVYRITQESLNNIVKHAQATAISVKLFQNGQYVNLEIHDNGIGFDSPTNKTDQFGLEIMSERAQSIGASFKIQSEPGEGTEVSLCVPVIHTKSLG